MYCLSRVKSCLVGQFVAELKLGLLKFSPGMFFVWKFPISINSRRLSMAKAVVVGDIGTDHDGFPPTKVTSGSLDVKFDFMSAARVGDQLEPHSKPKHPPHGRTISSGSSTVMVNGKPAAITGGSISCGGVTIGSSSVNIGDLYTPAPTSVLSKTLYDINLKVKDTNGYICPFMEVLCSFDDGSELVMMKTDANGELKGLAKGERVQKVSVKPNKTKKWLLRDS